MRVAIVTARPSVADDVRARHAGGMAAGLRAAGLEVEHLAADHALAPRLWESVRMRARTFDVVHVLGVRALPAVFAAHGRARAVVVSPQTDPGPITALRRLLNRPSGRASRALLEMADRVVCSTSSEMQRLGHVVPAAASRMRVVPLGVDTAAIRLAEPLPGSSRVIVVLSGPGRTHRIGRAVAALADLGPRYELVVAGTCAHTRQIRAGAAQLSVRDRVRFLGPVDDTTLHRWLRTASVVLALSERWVNPQLVLGAVSAGTPVILNELAGQLDALGDEPSVTLVPPEVSPLGLADLIAAASRPREPSLIPSGLPTIEDEISALLSVYGELVDLPVGVGVADWAGVERRAAS